MQSKTHSLIEACCNTLSGLVLSVVVWHYLYPVFGWQPTWSQNISLTLILTFISIARSYVWRRAFNWFHHVHAAPVVRTVCPGIIYQASDTAICGHCGQQWDYGDQPTTHTVLIRSEPRTA